MQCLSAIMDFTLGTRERTSNRQGLIWKHNEEKYESNTHVHNCRNNFSGNAAQILLDHALAFEKGKEALTW